MTLISLPIVYGVECLLYGAATSDNVVKEVHFFECMNLDLHCLQRRGPYMGWGIAQKVKPKVIYQSQLIWLEIGRVKNGCDCDFKIYYKKEFQTADVSKYQ